MNTHMEFEYFYTHPNLGSLVVSAVEEKLRLNKSKQKDKDPKCLCLFGRKLYF